MQPTRGIPWCVLSLAITLGAREGPQRRSSRAPVARPRSRVQKSLNRPARLCRAWTSEQSSIRRGGRWIGCTGRWLDSRSSSRRAP